MSEKGTLFNTIALVFSITTNTYMYGMDTHPRLYLLKIKTNPRPTHAYFLFMFLCAEYFIDNLTYSSFKACFKNTVFRLYLSFYMSVEECNNFFFYFQKLLIVSKRFHFLKNNMQIRMFS